MHLSVRPAEHQGRASRHSFDEPKVDPLHWPTRRDNSALQSKQSRILMRSWPFFLQVVSHWNIILAWAEQQRGYPAWARADSTASIPFYLPWLVLMWCIGFVIVRVSDACLDYPIGSICYRYRVFKWLTNYLLYAMTKWTSWRSSSLASKTTLF